jgi:hypothetical protein
MASQMAGKPLFNPKGLLAARQEVERTGLNRQTSRTLLDSSHSISVSRNTGLSAPQEVGLSSMLAKRKKELNSSPIDDVKRVAGAAIPGVYLADTIVAVAQNTLNRVEKGSQRYEPGARIGAVPVQKLGSKITNLPGNTAALLRAKLATEKAGINVRSQITPSGISKDVVLTRYAASKGFGIRK